MTRTIVAVASALAVSLLFGCTAQTPEEAGSSDLSLVRKADYEGQVRYLDEAVSAAPLTAEELGDTAHAIPVEVRFYDEWAVAWFVSEGVAQVGDPDMAMKVWLIEEHVPTSGDELDGTGGGSTEEPAPSGSLVTDVNPGAGTDTGIHENPAIDPEIYSRFPFARLDWIRDRIEEWESRPPAYHPGCL